MPTWAQEGSREDVLNRLRDPVTRRRIMVETIRILLEGRGGGDARNVMVSRCDWNSSLAGQRLDDVAATRGKSRSVEDAADTALWLVENGDCGGIYFAISEEDIQRVLKHPGIDGRVRWPGRVVRPRQPASAQLRHVRARPRPIRARAQGSRARRRDSQDVLVPGAAHRARRPRRSPAWDEGRHRHLRSGDRFAMRRRSSSRTNTPRVSLPSSSTEKWCLRVER